MRVVFISSMLPSGHFSQILTRGLNKLPNLDLIVYTDKNPQNYSIENCGKIKTVWSKNWQFIFQIVNQALKDKPEIIHLQQEFNMYGNLTNALLFPFLVASLRLLRFKTVVTIHAAFFKSQVNKQFISFFFIKKSAILNPFILKLFFFYVYKLSSFFANGIICHSLLMKKILSEDWGVDKNKIYIVPTSIPKKKFKRVKKTDYFFCYGYMVRRKGLQAVLKGFSQFHQSHKKYKLILAGGTIAGQEKALEEIKSLITKLKLNKNVIIKGFVEDSDLAHLYPKAKAVIIPAKISMGSSGPLYQAQAFGKCILASNVGHFREDINNLKDGILVDNSNWSQALEFVLKNPKLVSKIERNIQIRARQKNPTNIAKKHLEVYNHIL